MTRAQFEFYGRWWSGPEGTSGCQGKCPKCTQLARLEAARRTKVDPDNLHRKPLGARGPCPYCGCPAKRLSSPTGTVYGHQRSGKTWELWIMEPDTTIVVYEWDGHGWASV